MHIREIGLAERRGRARVEADVVWEDADRPQLRLYAETDRSCADGFWPDPCAFLAASAVPAWQAGEQRIRIDGELCPVLRDRLRSVFATLRAWYPELGPPPVIESDRARARLPFGKEASSFLSCGIDSLAVLRLNRLQLPADHPSAIRAVLLVDFVQEYGLGLEESSLQAAKRVEVAHCVVNDLGIDAIPITTNVLELEPDGNVFSFKWHAAALLFTAYLLSGRFCKAQLASSYDAAHLEPWGSHPLLDANYGSAHLEVEHAGLHLSRLEKTALVADWPMGLNAIRVCQGKNSGATNCGACEKCIRTMTALVALGKLQQSSAFPAHDVQPELLATVRAYGMLYNDSQAAFYDELLGPLQRIGRGDLAAEIELILEDFRAKRILQDDVTWAKLIANGNKVILAHNEIYGLEPARHGSSRCWGQPSNDRAAVRQIQSLQTDGATHLVFRPDTFWWLEYFQELNRHLHRCYRCLAQTEAAVIFELTDAAHPSCSGSIDSGQENALID